MAWSFGQASDAPSKAVRDTAKKADALRARGDVSGLNQLAASAKVGGKSSPNRVGQRIVRRAATRGSKGLSLYRSKNGLVDISLTKGATNALNSLSPGGKNEAPQNAGQWLMNLLSSGAYAVGEGAYRSNAMTDQATRKLGRGDIGGGLGDLANAGQRFLRGAGVGFAEGVGQRPEGRKPVTPSQVLNGKIDLEGVTDPETLREQRKIIREGGFNGQTLDKLDGSRAVDNGATGAAAEVTKKGLLNFGEDVLLDPTTFLTLGVGGAAKGAVKGASEAVRGASEAAAIAGRTAGAGERATKGLLGGVRGAVTGGAREFGEQFTGPAQNLSNVRVRALARKEGRLALKGPAARAAATDVEPASIIDDVPATDVARATPEVSPGAAVAAREAEQVAPEQIAPEQAIDTPAADAPVQAPDVPNQTEAWAAKIESDNRRSIAGERDAAVRGAVDEINGPLGRITVDSERILTDARRPVGDPPLLTRDHVQTLQDIAAGPLPEVKARITAAGKGDAALAKIMKMPTDVKIGAEKITVARLIERIATKRATGVSSPVAAAGLKMDQAALSKALAEASRVRATTSPESLQAALDASGVALPENITIQDLYERLKTAGSPANRQQVLKDTLERQTGQRFASVEDAIRAAVGGELDFAGMRKIAKALGLTTARSRDDLQKILTDRAMPAWEDIRNQLDTPDDIVVSHGISPESLERSAEADVPAVQEAAAANLDEARQNSLDEILGREGRSATREMLDAVVESLGRALTREHGEMIPGATEAFGNGRWLDMWRQAARRFSFTQGARLQARPLERSLAADRSIMAAMEGGEDYARSIGVFPRISDEHGVDAFGGPLFASISQLLRGLPDDVRRAAFFPESISMSNVQKGITLYPTTFGNAVRRAVASAAEGKRAGVISAETYEFIRAQARIDARQAGAGGRLLNSWVASTEGQDAISKLATTIAQPEYLENIRAIHAATEPLAVRAASDAADGVTRPALAGLTEIISRGGPDMRREVLELVNRARADADAQRVATGNTDNLVSDLAHQRLTTGLIEGILGEDGTRSMRSEQRLVKGQEPEEARKAAIAAAERGKPRIENRRAQQEQLKRAADDAAADAADEAPMLDDAVDEVNAYREDTDLLSDIETRQQAHLQMGILRVAHDVTGTQLSGSFGMGQRLKAALMRGENVANTSAAQFTTRMRKVVRTWAKDLQSDLRLNKVADYDTVVAQSRHWISLLARAPEDVGPAQLRGWLSEQGLSDAQADMAAVLKDQIDHVFGTNLGRSRVLASDLYKQMSGYAAADVLPDPRVPLGDQATVWKQWSNADVDPLDTLNRWSHAVKMAQVTPSVAHAAEQSFGHKALGMTAAEAKAAGWKRLNVAGPNADLARHFSPDTYFDPDTIRRLSYVQNFLNASARFEGKTMKQVVGTYDAVLRVLKSAATVWRPGHHITNILGEIGVNLMDGVSPLNTIRALRSMREGGSLLDADWSILDRADFGGPVNPKYLTGDVVVNINGKGVSVSLRDLYNEALASGVAQSHSTARDISDPLVEQLHPGRLAKVREVLGKPDEALGKFSAARDNVTRMAHLISLLERGKYRSLDEAFNRASARVHDFHPSFLTLSMGERKYARRIFYFYTWQRQAISLILRTAVDRPGLVSAPSKLQYGFAQANGLDPESIGQVQNGDERLPSYYQDTLLGPQWAAGDTPFSQPSEVGDRILRTAGLEGRYESVDAAIWQAQNGEMSITDANALLKALGDSMGPYTRQSTIEAHLDDQAGRFWQLNKNGHLWGLSLSQPQMDTLQSLFAGANVGSDKGVTEGTARELILGNLAPTLKAPIEIAAQRQLTGNMSELDKSGGTGAYLFNTLGAPSQLSKLLPAGDGSGQSVYQSKFPRNSDKYTTPESNANERQRALLNFLLGMKFTDFTSDSAQAVRRVEDKDAGAK